MSERTFVDLEPSPKRPCPRCGISETTVSLRLQAQQRFKGKNGAVLASRSLQLCESCAVSVYERLNHDFVDEVRLGLPTLEAKQNDSLRESAR